MTVAAAPTPSHQNRFEPADELVLDRLIRHGDHTSGFLTFNAEMQHFLPDGCDGFIAYRPIGRRHVVQLCGPFTADADRAAALEEFTDWVERQGRRLLAVQLRPGDAELYAEQGFAVNQLGSSYSLDLDEFTLRGKAFMKIRNKISRARRKGIVVEEVADEEDAGALDAIDADWLRGKGRHVNRLEFLVGERGGRGRSLRRVFVARLEGRPIAYVTYSPVYGQEHPGWLYDLTRRRVEAPPGTIELIFTSAIAAFREEGTRWLHMGLTPCVGMDDEHELPAARSRPVTALLRQIADRGKALYPARDQEAFKLKWTPSLVEPEYLAFQGRPNLGAVIGLLRLTRSIPW